MISQIVKTFYQLNNEQDTLEVCLVLFTKCNLRCPFCFQDRNGIDTQYIQEIPQKLDIEFRKFENRYSKIMFRIWGGELFADDIPDSMFDIYDELVANLKTVCEKHGFEAYICFSTNLVFNNVERVYKLVAKTNAVVATSYDPKYRFHNEEQLNKWKENALLFKPHTVSITLTKQNIQSFISEPTHFENLKDYSISIEYYIFNTQHKFFKPSEDDLFSFYKYCIDNKINNIPEVNAVIASLDSSIGRYCNCNNSCLYLDGKLTFNCLKRSSNLQQTEFFDVVPDEANYTETQLKEALARKKCILCKNYSFCRMYCMASVLHKSVDNSDCGMYKVYEYLRSLKCQ